MSTESEVDCEQHRESDPSELQGSGEIFDSDSTSERSEVLPEISDRRRPVGRPATRNISDGNFRLRGKRFLCTYPQTPHAASAALTRLIVGLGANRYLVCRERHQDQSEHLHVYFEILRGFSSRNANSFDFESDGVSYHGNYQVVRSPRGAAAYVLKDGDFDQHGFTKAEIESLRKAARGNLSKHIGERLMQGDRIEAICRDHVDLIVRSDISRIQRQADAVRAYDIELADRVMIEFDLFDFMCFFWKDVPIRGRDPNNCLNLHYWIWGQPGCGKSQTFMNMPYRFYYVDDINNWALFDNSAFDAILFDDCDPNDLTKFGFSKLNRLLDCNPIRMNCKHGHANVVKKMPIIFISNWNILEFSAPGNSAFPAFLSRLHVLNVVRTPGADLYSTVNYCANPFHCV